MDLIKMVYQMNYMVLHFKIYFQIKIVMIVLIKVILYNLMIHIVKQMELKRVCIAVGGLHAVDDRPTHTMDEIAVKKSNGLVQPSHQISFELLPFFRLHVADRHSATTPVKDMQIVAADFVRIPDPYRETSTTRLRR